MDAEGMLITVSSSNPASLRPLSITSLKAARSHPLGLHREWLNLGPPMNHQKQPHNVQRATNH